jgi:CRISPR/Cas system-associated exonuclease Cas4 (RecB family)
MKVIRASEIGTYEFCNRAWWYWLKGYESENKVEIAGGSEIHEQHGRVVVASNCLQLLAYASFLLAILAATIWLIQTFL